ncbi:Serine protease 7 [Eumeta japonica]|uniref:CLIP domain-containing serine protease n=1 Tax=Eumeta variegata TaxID=151549 RepID=A0A4C1UM74_EUMVA|nr:Serine protease 7 [Eumeta japonica]
MDDKGMSDEMPQLFQLMKNGIRKTDNNDCTYTTDTLTRTIYDKIKPLLEENKHLKSEVQTLNRKVKYLEELNRKNNIIIHGVKETENKHPKVRDLLERIDTYQGSKRDSCVTPLGVTSECVSLYACPSLLSAFEQRPIPNRIVNFLRKSQCGFDGSTPRVCCGPIPYTRDPSTQTSTAPPPPQNNFNYDGRVDPISSEDSVPAARGQCGIDTNGDRLYGGQITDIDEFPWMCLLGYLTRSGNITFQCGGVLINKRYVLTAAHCVKGAIEREVGTLAVVRLGEYDTLTSTDCVESVDSERICADAPQDVPVLRAYAHDGYSDKNINRRDDIAVVRLARRATYSYYVKPICLPDTNTPLATGDYVTVAGWGKTLRGTNSNVKLKLRMPIYNKQECGTKYRRLGAELTEKQLCAGGVFKEDACRGDSGGPLMRERPGGVWESVAVVSFGNGCGLDGWPGVYTSVASYRGWIENIMQSTNV